MADTPSSEKTCSSLLTLGFAGYCKHPRDGHRLRKSLRDQAREQQGVKVESNRPLYAMASEKSSILPTATPVVFADSVDLKKA
jgi:hypothetical protein